MSRRRSNLWQHFKDVKYGELARCNTCKVNISYKGGGTSNLKKHMVSIHPTVNIQAICESDEGESSSQRTLYDFNVNINLSKARESEINKALVKLVTDDLQPLSIVENKGFLAFAKSMNPAYKVPSRYILTKKLLKEENDIAFNSLKNSICGAEHICITTDAWTSCANESYISLTAHYITSEWELSSKFLNCFEIVKDHTAENLRNEILQSLTKWGLENKISCVVSDNAPNIIAAIRLGGWASMPCFAHTLHLIVTDGLKIEKICQLVTKCKAAAEYFNRSTKASIKLKEMQKQMGKPKQKLINDVATRWNSTLNMIQRILSNQEVLEATVAILHHPIKLFSVEEWQILKELCAILRPFHEVTVEMSAEKYTTVSKILVLTRGLQSFLIKKKTEDNVEEISILLERFINNFNKRFHRVEFNEVLAISTYLDPRFKIKGFTDSSAITAAKNKISSLYKVHHTEITSPPEQNKTNESIWNEFDQRSVINTPTSKCIVELNNFSHEKFLDRKSDPLEWWKMREFIYPGLSELAKKYLPIVATSVPSERVFSTAGQVVTDRRSLLTSGNVEKILVLHFNDVETHG